MSFNRIFVALLILILVNIVSVIACLWLLIHFLRMKTKLLSMKMIAVLCLSDLVFHITLLTTTLFSQDTPLVRALLYIEFTAFQFSVFWTFNMTYLLYKLLSNTTIRCLKHYIVSTTIIILALAVLASLL